MCPQALFLWFLSFCGGGSVPVFDEVVISLARMNDVLNLDSEAGIAIGGIRNSLLQYSM